MAIGHFSQLYSERSADCPPARTPETLSSSRQAATPAYSIFHERWWLDIATGGDWDMATVMHGNQLLGEMPYYLARKGVWRVSRLPLLTRTLALSSSRLGPIPCVNSGIACTSQRA